MQYHGVDKKRNEVGVISSVKRVVEVKTVSHKDVRAAQIGCQLPEKEQFWSRMDEGVEIVPRERAMTGVDRLKGTKVNKEVLGRCGVKERNAEEWVVVDLVVEDSETVVCSTSDRRLGGLHRSPFLFPVVMDRLTLGFRQ